MVKFLPFLFFLSVEFIGCFLFITNYLLFILKEKQKKAPIYLSQKGMRSDTSLLLGKDKIGADY